MRFAKVKIGNIGQVVTGKTPPTKSPELYGEAYPFITPTDISDDSCYAKPTRYISEEGRSAHRNAMLPPYAVCYTCIASIGKACLTTETSLTNQQINSIIVDHNSYDYRFIYYLLKHETPRIKALASGVATPIINKSMFSEIELQMPPLSTQKKIAAILSAYDALIENNLRRIKILEEMTQSLFREWFVKFRFPGHQKVKMVSSPLGKIPEGWEVAELSQVSRVVDCLRSKKPSEAATPVEQYGVLLHIWNIPGGGRLDLTEKFLINEEDYREWTKNIEVIEGDCVITNVGRVGDFAQIPRGVRAAIGRNMTAVRPIKEGVSPTFLIEYLRSPFMDKERSAKVDRGTIMDSLNVKGIVKLLVPMPPKELMKQFENLGYPLLLQAQILQEKIGNLRQTRDLLLPKLISGELDVSELDITIPEANA